MRSEATGGLVVLQFQGNFVTKYTLSGEQVNGCGLLKGCRAQAELVEGEAK